ncbi:MAG: primosomal protein N' [Oscillospiraceae bacterium]|nr:primosomal protein N' [Oscillospiraceae bacterium]
MSNVEQFARVVIKDIPYTVDRPYDYRIPEALAQQAIPGMRVMVPFGMGNRKTEGCIISVSRESEYPQAKCILSCLDPSGVLEPGQIKLALWMRQRFFCAVFDALKAMLPAGLWYDWNETVSLVQGVTAEIAFEAASGDSVKILELLFSSKSRKAGIKECREAIGKDPAKAVKGLCEKGLCLCESVPRRKIGDKSEMCAELTVSCGELDSLTRISPLQRDVLRLLGDSGSTLIRDISYLTGAGMNTIRGLEKRELIATFSVPAYRKLSFSTAESAQPIVFNQEQQASFDRCAEALDSSAPACGLLYGVTGSGKTSVYIRLVEKVLNSGGSAIVLVPEIALTPQLMCRFSAHFGSRAALLHSGLSIGERMDEWKRIRQGSCQVALGTRSAIFAPVKSLRLIIIDEEHEASYKSENTPRYHAVEVAKYLCTQNSALLLLGSATPSVESYQNAMDKTYFLCRMDARYNQRELPQARVVSMREELRQGNGRTISSVLYSELCLNLEKGEQSILLLNRRGHNRLMLCPACGHKPECFKCSVTLSYHSANRRMMCHYCGYSIKYNGICSECGSELLPVGAGTQRVAQELEELFPGRDFLRLDSDTAAGKGSHERILDAFRKKKIPFLIGTQMVAKGLDFENVTLVGVLNADASLCMDDFRAYERTFSLITQVLGRSGRGELPGRAIIQTYMPDHPVILSAARQDYDAFFKEESALRRLQGYPPFQSLCRLTVFGTDQDDVLRAGVRVREWIERAALPDVSRVMGPAPSGVLRVNMRYRYHILLLGESTSAFRCMISGILSAFPKERKHRGVYISADGNPM